MIVRHLGLSASSRLKPAIEFALKRQELEEAGVEISPKSILGIEHSLPETQERNSPSFERWRFFLTAEYIEGEPKTEADSESLQAKWFELGELATLNLRTPFMLKLIQKHQSRPSVLPIESYDTIFF